MISKLKDILYFIILNLGGGGGSIKNVKRAAINKASPQPELMDNKNPRSFVCLNARRHVSTDSTFRTLKKETVKLLHAVVLYPKNK